MVCGYDTDSEWLGRVHSPEIYDSRWVVRKTLENKGLWRPFSGFCTASGASYGEDLLQKKGWADRSLP